MDSLEQPRQWKMGMRLGTWNITSVYRTGSMKTVASKLAKYNLDPVAVQEVRQDEGGSQPEDNYTFFNGNGNTNYYLGTGFFVHKGIMLEVK
jgi:exonuclease III